jgi:HAD superfamily hydrolase (TIGR01509 family)
MSLDVRECFERLYGPDLVDTFKRSPEYYRRVFADAGVRPPDALVVDDNPGALEWAIQAGAQAILVHKEPPPDWAAARIRSLSELPRWLEGG